MIATRIGAALLMLLRADGDQVADPGIEAVPNDKKQLRLSIVLVEKVTK